MNTVPDRCPFCESPIMVHGGNLLRSSDGGFASYECKTVQDIELSDDEWKRAGQSDACRKREVQLLTKQRDEARERIKRLEEQQEHIKQWHDALTPLMPSDFKCWHENNPSEWPEVAAWVITSQRERIKRLESWIESLEVLEQHSGILPEREWFGSEIGYLRKGEAVYKGEAKP